MIPMVDLKTQYHNLKEEIDSALLNVLESTQFILGPNVRALEEECAQYLGVKHTVGCASGTDALHLALAAAGIGPGDEVITSPFTFIATAEAIRYVGAIPVFVDIEPHTYNLDVDQIEAAITPATKAILPVHIFGQPVDMAALLAISDKHDLITIEDCAQSFGAEISGHQTGSMSLAGCFSFFPSKNLGCYGDGGMVSTQSDEIYQRLLSLRNHGSSQRYHHHEIGYNSRLDEVQAAILRIKLKHIDAFNQNRRTVGRRYNAALTEMGLTPPHEDGIGTHVYHQYVARSDQRDRILEALRAEKIGCAIYYPIPLHRQDVFAEDYKDLSLPVAETVASDCFALPVFPEMTHDQVDTVIDVIRKAIS